MRSLPFVVLLFTACAGPRAATADPAALDLLRFDARFDAEREFSNKLELAAANHRRVLIVVGGEWCPSCRSLRQTMAGDRRIVDTLKSSYEVVTVNVDRDWTADAFIEQLPDVTEVPYLFVTDAEGTLLTGEGTAVLGSETGHDSEKVLALLQRWAR